MRVDLCGVRGSMPAAGAAFARVGGNTSCVAVTHDGERRPRLLLDAGTGLRNVGRLLTNPHLLIAPWMAREAILSSRIEGTGRRSASCLSTRPAVHGWRDARRPTYRRCATTWMRSSTASSAYRSRCASCASFTRAS